MYLITGAYGQLGHSLKNILGQEGLYVDRDCLDICNLEHVDSFVGKHRPKLIINCAAYTAVDQAESDEANAFLVNATGPENLARVAGKCGIPLIHVSTDYVFDGMSCRPYREDDETNPQSAYGRTKLAGEVAVLKYAETAAIVRTAWLYSTVGNNFVKTMQRLGRERSSLGVVSDQIGTPTYAPDLAQALLALAGRMTPGSRELYHFTNEGVASWYDFAVAIMELSGIDCQVTPIRTEDYPTPAKRPAYSVLDKSKMKSLTGLAIPYWRKSLAACVD